MRIEPDFSRFRGNDLNHSSNRSCFYFLKLKYVLDLVNTSESDSIGLPGGLVCNGVVDCAVYGEDELYCPQRYVCETGKSSSGNLKIVLNC